MKEDRRPNDEQRKEDFERSAFQRRPNRGAWTGGWRDLPGQRTWLASARRTVVEDGAKRAPPVDRERPDDEILDELREALAGLEAELRLEVVGGEVLLSGSAASPGVRLEALRIAASTPGVRVVHELLEVPVPRAG